ncbi:MAG: sigma-70 family RNA polymerase sigma factor [Minicystis sp.]
MDDADARLIAALNAGDEQAFAAFCRGVEGPLRGLVRRFVPDASVDDVVQQTWMRALESLGQFQGRARLSTWVLQIGLNLARTAVQREQREVALPEADDPDDDCFTAVGNWVTPPPTWPAALHDPEQVAGDRELLRHLEAALRALPDAWRAAVVLCDVEGLLPREAAAVLEVEDGNLRVLLHRGRARLRRSIEALLRAQV